MSTLTDSLILLGSSSSPLEKISTSANEAAAKLLKASGATQTLNKQLENTGGKANLAFSGLIKFLKSKSVIEGAKKGMKIVDDYINLQTRLNAVNDGLQTQAKLQDKVFAAANRSRGSYSAMVDTFANLQATAGNVFGSNDETLAFSELMQKSFKLGGTDSETQSAGMDTITKAMGAGEIDSGAFDAITANAPMMLQAMETFTGKSKAELGSMAEEGTLTAETLKNSLLAASGNINSEFSNMPMSFADIWNRIKNAALEASGGIFDGISSIINSGGFQTFLDAVIIGIYAVGGILDWIVDKFDYFAPILETIGGVLLVSIISGLWASAAAAWANVAPWLIESWAIILVVAAIVAVITALGAMGVTVQDVFGFIGGVIGVFVAVFLNFFGFLWNFIAAFINFFGNVFTHPIASIKALFLDLATNVIGYIATMAHGIEDLINKIPGVEVNITGGLDGLQNKLKKASETVKNEAGLKEYIGGTDFMSYSGTANTGANMAGDIYTGISDKLGGLADGLGLGSSGGLLGASNNDGLGTSNNPMTVQGTGSDGTLGVDMGEEDIQYLRDIAERDYINKFSTATVAPNIQVSFGDIHKEADADKVASRIQLILREQIATASEGVY